MKRYFRNKPLLRSYFMRDKRVSSVFKHYYSKEGFGEDLDYHLKSKLSVDGKTYLLHKEDMIVCITPNKDFGIFKTFYLVCDSSGELS